MEMDSKEKRYLKRYEISILLNAIENGEIDVIVSYITENNLKEKIQNLWGTERWYTGTIRDSIEKEYLSNIAAQIRKEDYSLLVAKISKQSSVAVRLILATEDLEYIKKCSEISTLDLDTKIRFIAATQDKNYIKDFLIKNKESLSGYQKAILIKGTNDKTFIKECIYDDTLKLEDYNKAALIVYIGEKTYIKDFIEKRELDLRSTLHLIVATKDTSYVRVQLRNLASQLSNRNIINVLRELDDLELIKEYIDGERLNVSEKVELLKGLDNSGAKYIEAFISKNSEKISEQDLVILISLTKDLEYIENVINGTEIVLSNSSKTAIVIRTKDKGLMQQYINEDRNLSIAEKKIIEVVLNPDFLEFSREEYKKINLPREMTIGIEIESEGKFSEELPRLLLNGRWIGKKDPSLEMGGSEVVSTILNGTEQDSKEIYQICELLGDIGQTTSERCGGHIHIGADFLTSKQAYFNLLEIYGNCEEIIYAISNNTNDSSRKSIKKFCLPIVEKLEGALVSGALDSKAELSEFIEQLKELQGDRYSGINFMNIATTKNTIEFRMPNGTINPETWIENVNLFGGIIKAAQELAIIQSKSPQEITEEDKARLMWLSKIKNPNIDENERLEALLSLTVEDKEVYRERYSKNIELMHADEEISETMKKARPTQPIDIRKIGATVLAGSNPVRGEEVEGVEQVFKHDIEQCIEGEITNEYIC